MAPLGEAALRAKRRKEAPENMCAHSQRHQPEAPETESEQRRRQKRAERHHKEPNSRQRLICMRAGAAGGRRKGIRKSLERLSIWAIVS